MPVDLTTDLRALLARVPEGYTEGPLVVELEDADCGGLWLVRDTENDSCTCFDIGLEADAKLYALAPDLAAALARAVEALDAANERAEKAEARVAELEAAAEKRADGYWHTVTVGQERMNAIVEQRDEARRALAESRWEVVRLEAILERPVVQRALINAALSSDSGRDGGVA